MTATAHHSMDVVGISQRRRLVWRTASDVRQNTDTKMEVAAFSIVIVNTIYHLFLRLLTEFSKRKHYEKQDAQLTA